MGIIQNAMNLMIGTVGLATKYHQEILEKQAKVTQKQVDPDKARSEQANIKAAEIAEKKQMQKKNFKKYTKDVQNTINLLKGRDINGNN